MSASAERTSAAGRMLTIAAQLDLVSSLLAVLTAVFAVGATGTYGAVASRVGALLRWSHATPLLALYALPRAGSSSAWAG